MSGWIERLPSGKHRGVYRFEDGRKVSRSFRLKSEARTWLNGIAADDARGTYIDERRGRITVAEWFGDWWGTEVGNRLSTQDRDRRMYENHVLPTFGSMKLSDVKQPHVKTWVAELDKDGYARTTIDKGVQLLRKLMEAAVDAELIARSPVYKIKLPQAEYQEMKYLTPEQLAELAGVITPRFSAMIMLLGYSGLRIGEVIGLRRRDVHLQRNALSVNQTVVEVSGGLVFNPPKTAKGRRVVPIPPDVSKLLAQHMAAVGVIDPDAFIFTGAYGGTLRARAWSARHFKPAVATAGLAPLRVHDLRHTAIAMWIAAGVDVKQIAERAGHTSVAVVLDRYGHLLPSAEETFREKVAQLYVAPVKPSDAEVIELRSRR